MTMWKKIAAAASNYSPYFLASEWTESTGVFDSSLNSIAATPCVVDYTYGTYGAVITRRDKAGKRLWRKLCVGGSGTQTVPNLAFANGSHSFLTLDSNNINAGILKINASSGALLFGRSLTNLGTSMKCISGAADSSGNSYLMLSTVPWDQEQVYVIKIDSDGNTAWKKRLYDANSNLQLAGNSIYADNSGNLFATVIKSFGGSNHGIVITKLNSSTGSLISQHQFQSGSSITNIANTASVMDSSGNLYFAFRPYDAGVGGYAAAVCKWSTVSSTMTWVRQIRLQYNPNYSQSSVDCLTLKLDEVSGRLFVLGGAGYASFTSAMMVCLNVNGTTSYNRRYSPASPANKSPSFTAAAATPTHVYCYSSGSWYGSILGGFMALPADGTKTYTDSKHNLTGNTDLYVSSWELTVATSTSVLVGDPGSYPTITNTTFGYSDSALSADFTNKIII